jgi:prophage regulatory protein
MISENRVARTAQQHALTAAVERIKTAAKREARDLIVEEIVLVDALAAALAMLTRDINYDIDVATSAAHADENRPHALARGPPPDGESILRWRQVRARTGLSRASIWRAVRAGTFPRPVQIMGPSTVGWLASEVECWIQSRVAQRDQQHQRAVPRSPGRPRKAAAASTNPHTSTGR